MWNESRQLAIQGFPPQWERIISAWRAPAPGNKGWLTFSANYLFQTGGREKAGGILWALDPLTLPHRLGSPDVPDLSADLDGLRVVLLSHAHRDHYDPRVIQALKDLPIPWIVPPALLSRVTRDGLPTSRIVEASDLVPIQVEGLTITPFEGLHWEEVPPQHREKYPSGRRGLPAKGYLVEQEGRRWLFPGDTRLYRASQLPRFGPVDVLFAHLWLGRGCAAGAEWPRLEEFCRFCLDLQPRRIVLTHLREWGREPPDFWDVHHGRAAVEELHRLAPQVEVEIALAGDEFRL
jgi:L-ascorbate metabolism protein UlaG (beta-lactamase superfamily)